MFARYARSWQLTKQSFKALAENPVLMVFPCLSGLATLLVIVSFLVPLFATGALTSMARQPGQFDPLRLVLGFAFYYCCFFVQIFFTCALMASANMVFCGGKPSLKHGLDIAWSRVGQIAAWALIAATVGWILRTLQERAGLLGRIVIAILGIAWAILTYFSVPVVLFEHYSLFAGIKRSGELVKKTWGEAAGKGVTFVAFNLVAMAGWIVGLVVTFFIHPIVGALWAVSYLALWMIVAATVDGIFRVALYRYACFGDKTPVFAPELITNAFVQKKRAL
ncbi:MAG TPA: DUF6159 family protein [Candidatus Angelobacter sp.]|nr:DUF6159 family protein [Candidatus Angelobacter sp.]